MNENQLIIVEKYQFDKPLIHKKDPIIDNCTRDCHDKLFHTFEYSCVYNINFTNTANNEIFNLPDSDKSMGLYELNKKLKTARQRGFVFNQISKLTTKIYCNLSNINICF